MRIFCPATLLLPHSYLWAQLGNPSRAAPSGALALRWYAAAVFLSVVHRSPRSGVSPLRTLSRDGNRRDRGGDRMRPFGRWSYARGKAAPKRHRPGSRQPEQYALDVGPHPNLWPRKTRDVLTPE